MITYCLGNMERKPRPTDWTTTEIDTLRALAKEGKTIDEIAQVLGRTASAVNQKGKKLHILKKKEWFWSSSEIIKLRHLAQTHTYKAAGKELGRSWQSVKRKAMSLGISFFKHGEALPHTKFSNEVVEEVFRLREQGLSLPKIGKRLNMHHSTAGYILNFAFRYRDSLSLNINK